MGSEQEWGLSSQEPQSRAREDQVARRLPDRAAPLCPLPHTREDPTEGEDRLRGPAPAPQRPAQFSPVSSSPGSLQVGPGLRGVGEMLRFLSPARGQGGRSGRSRGSFLGPGSPGCPPGMWQ